MRIESVEKISITNQGDVMPLATRKLARILLFLFVFPALSLMGGCALFGGGEPVDEKDDTLSLVFGYFDMEEAPSWGGIDWVSIKQFKPETTYYGCGVEDGLFFHVGVRNGASIQVDSFGRNTRWYSNTRYTYNFGSQGRNSTSTVVNKPGVYFLGAFKYTPIDSGSFFKADSFDMTKTSTPTEKELLTKLLQIMTNDSDLSIYTHQIGRIKARLSQLK